MGRLNRKTDKGRIGVSGKRILFFLFLLLVVGVTGILWCRYTTRDRQDKQRYEKLQEEKREEGIPKLRKRYKDMVGWLEIKKSDFSYPVMQTKNDPEYYLHRDEKGGYSFYGTPFLDFRCSLESDNLIIYGHNINGRRFFGYLQNYRDREFYESHKTLCFSKVDGVEETYPIISVMKTDTDSDCYRYTDIYNDEEYRDLVKEILNNSLYRCEGADILEKEMNEETVEAFFHKYQFLTLSTCRTGEGRDARLLVIGCKKR
ncbi:MAG: class B sortase [Eubacterium sp.]|jgi:sortase B|nr:class B sortase [Eubacterium sp.]